MLNNKSPDPVTPLCATIFSPVEATQCPVAAPDAGCTPPSPPLTDEALAQWLNQVTRTADHVLVIASGYTALFLSRPDAGTHWSVAGTGDFGTTSLIEAKKLLDQGRLWWAEAAGIPEAADVNSAVIALATKPQIKLWQAKVGKLTGFGREAEASPKTRDEVAYLAAWRCQFSGCGRNLKKHLATGQPGRFSYFAHIIAASPEGPRGNLDLSLKLANDPSNIMLLCDECHRLVDRVNPAKYTTEVLREMRERNIIEVQRLLSALQYEDVETLVVMGNISGQPPLFSMRHAEEALWGSKLRAAEGRPEWFFQGGGHQHDPHSADYWGSLFRTLKLDLPRMQSYLNGNRQGGSPRPRLAVFPLHGTSLLILAGRVLGDTGGTYLFQPHRNRPGELTATRWIWPSGAVEPLADKYKVRVLKIPNGEVKEACLVVSLTFAVESGRLPALCADATGFLLPTIEVFVDAPNFNVIGHPNDLAFFGAALDKALRQLQDDWAIEKVHLVVGAPSTACVIVGQKMQARNQATFVCHEATGGLGSPFKPTIEISTSQVRELVAGQTISLQP